MWKNILISAAFGTAMGLVAVYLANNMGWAQKLTARRTTGT